MEHLIQLLALLDLSLLAQVKIDALQDKGIPIIMGIALIVCICGIIVASFQLMAGNMLFAVYILLGSLLCGGSVVVAKAFFSLSGIN